MSFRKIAGPLRVATEKNGTVQSYALETTSGGSKARTGQYSLVITARSSASCELQMDLNQSPNGVVWSLHTALLPKATVTNIPSLRVGDADTTKILGEYLQCLIAVDDNGSGTEEWAIVEVWEMLKPF